VLYEGQHWLTIFFDFKAPKKQTYEAFLHSIIMQISGQSPIAWQILIELIAYIEDQYVETAWVISVNLLLHLLERYLVVYDRIYIVLDVPNEPNDQDTTLNLLLDLLARSSGEVSIIVTNRPQVRIAQEFEGSSSESDVITSEKIQHDARSQFLWNAHLIGGSKAAEALQSKFEYGYAETHLDPLFVMFR
jgi:hypothetical protein